MSTPKPTPGPWTVRLDTCSSCRDYGQPGEWNVDGPDAGYHATFKNEADARLVVAACNACQQFNPNDPIGLADVIPTLVDLLFRALPYLEDATIDEHYKRGSVAKLVSEVRAALAKAEGRPTP